MAKHIKDSTFPTGRMEAFSDGVIAIIITLMILEVKPPDMANHEVGDTSVFVHHLVAYTMSFIMLGIYWVNHHNFFHKVQNGDRKLLWMNLNLLFWMSIIPIPTGFLGSHYTEPIASVFYGFVLFMNSISFTLMGAYATKKGLFSGQIPMDIQKRNMRRNRLGLGLYVSAMILSYISVYISFAIFILVAAMYFMPRLGFEKSDSKSSIPEIIADDLYKVEGKIEEVIHKNLSKTANMPNNPEKKSPPKVVKTNNKTDKS